MAGKPGPHTPGHRAELLAVPGVALPDDSGRNPPPAGQEKKPPVSSPRGSWNPKNSQPPAGQDRKTSPSSFFKPSLGELEVLPAVEDVQEPVFQLLRVLPDNAIEVDQVAVGVVEHLPHGPLLVEQHRTRRPRTLPRRPCSRKPGGKPFEGSWGNRACFPPTPGNNGLNKFTTTLRRVGF